MTETDLQRAIIDTLLWDDWLVLRVNQGAMRRDSDLIRFAYWQALGSDESHAGISDVMALKDGTLLLIEVKLPGKYTTAEQDRFLQAARDHGAVGLIARSVEDLDPYLERVVVQ